MADIVGNYSSLFLYNYEISNFNNKIDFKTSSGGSQKTANLLLGFYSLTSLSTEIIRAMQEADNTQTYSVSVNRGVMGGLQNRITISSSGSYFSLLFGTGTHLASSIAPYLGFNPINYTGATSYTSSTSSGTSFLTTYPPYNYLGPTDIRDIQGSRTITVNGQKEAITYPTMEFIEAEWKYETFSRKETLWVPLLTWAIAQKRFEITPDYTQYNDFYEVTLEKTARSSTGMGYQFKQQLPQFPGLFSTQKLTFRRQVTPSLFVL